MKILIFGLGLNGGGFSAAKYFLEHNNEVIITDLKTEESFKQTIKILSKLGAIFHLGEHKIEDFMWADIVVKNPSILPNNKYLQYSKKIINDFSYLFDNYNFDNIKLIGITGTKGKTTTSHAISHVLNKLNYNAKLVGNMGISAFEIASYLENEKEPIDFLICEFSSWQLRDTFLYLDNDFPSFTLSIFTNLLEDHQNTYDSMESYLQDKLNLFTIKTQNVICPNSFKKAIMEKTKLKKKNITGIDSKQFNSNITKPELYIAYKALSILGIKNNLILQKFNTFNGVSHRIEWVNRLDNILFVNDSAATIPEAVAFSTSHFKDVNIHLICGGTDKNLKVNSMIPVLKGVKSITILDGSFSQNKLIPFLKDSNIDFSGPFKQMKTALKHAFENAIADSSIEMKVILLSPGATSFDLFINEFDRGNQFKKLVNYIIDKSNI